jgi:hypothetical protein
VPARPSAMRALAQAMQSVLASVVTAPAVAALAARGGAAAVDGIPRPRRASRARRFAGEVRELGFARIVAA